jgi:uncharacterized protein (TIGR00369 family)
MSEIQTHEKIDRELCGDPVEVEEGRATVRFEATDRMVVDGHGLVHGGFVFGLADHAAMLAVNDPNVVLASAETRFLAPAEVGDEVVAEADVVEVDGKKHVIEATARVGDREIFSGTFTAFVTDEHVLG